MVARLFRWLGGPIELRDLTNAVSELLGYSKTRTAAADEKTASIDPGQSPAEALIWKEYLTWIWQEIGRLCDRQARWFLLNTEVLLGFEMLGATGDD